MKDPRKVVLVSVIIVLALMFGLTFLKESFRNKNKKISPPISVSPTKVENKYENWTLFKNGYTFPLPPDWKNSSDIGGTAVLEPKDQLNNELNNIKKISVTVLSDKKSTGQRFTTEKEFIEWSTLIAMAVYAIVAYGIVALFQLIKPTNPEEVEQTVDNQ